MGTAFSNVLEPLEGLVKLLINTYEDEFKKPSKSYSVMYNPTSLEQEFKPRYDTVKVDGNKEIQKFKYVGAEVLNVELLFDATGASTSDGSSVPADAAAIASVEDLAKTVADKKNTYDAIAGFLSELYNVGSETHKPRFVQVIWGTLKFEGVLESSKITHSLFGSDGKPIRSKVLCAFKGHQPLPEQAAETKKNSPDLTRFKQVLAADNLPLIAFDTYNDPSFYLELAKVNRINNFRAVKNGSRLRLPPVKK